MNRTLRLYDLAVSPNSIKVRTALAYKKIPWERVPVDPGRREEVVRVSGQPLTPVLTHGDIVVYDSYAITRYLDANFPGTPRLYSADRDTMKAIEQWEQFTRAEAGAAVSLMFGQFFAPSVDAAKVGRANEIVNRAAARVEETLAKGEWLVGAAPTAADFAVGTMMYPGAVPEKAASAGPVWAFFRKHLRIEDAPRTVAWIGRIMEWDRP